VLEGPAAIIEWMRGTGLRPYLERLEPGEREPFLEDLLTRLTPAFPPLADGRVIYPFPRLFLLARA
jgi:trans-aconitate 2-methyltransferase